MIAWKMYVKDMKMQKAIKKTEYYRNKIDDLEKQLANSKMLVLESNIEKQRYKEMAFELKRQVI